jgi:hypothetical protein
MKQRRRRISGENDAARHETHPDYQQRRRLSATMGAHQTQQSIHRIHAQQREPPDAGVAWKRVHECAASARRDRRESEWCEVRCVRRRREASKNAPAEQKKDTAHRNRAIQRLYSGNIKKVTAYPAIGLFSDYIREHFRTATRKEKRDVRKKSS